MSDVIITRRGWGEDGKPQLRTETITGTVDWIVPEYKGEGISVLIYGGGGGGCNWGTQVIKLMLHEVMREVLLVLVLI